MRDDLRKSTLYCDLGLANVRNVSFETSNPPEGERAGERMRGMMEQNALQPGLPGETGLPCRFLEQTLEAGMSASSTWGVLCALTSHLLLPTSILRKQMEGQTGVVQDVRFYTRKRLREG